MIEPNEIGLIAAKAFAAPGYAVVQGDTLWKMINGEWVGKPYVTTKTWSMKWLEDVKPEDINTEYFNLDGTRKQL